MEDFKKFKFAFNYCDKSRKVMEPEQFYWAVQCFKKLNKVNYKDQKVRDFLKQFSVKALHLGMLYCRRVDHEFRCECEYCFLFDNSKLILLNSYKLADCFVANICDVETIFSYRSACPKLCYKSTNNFQNIDRWAGDNSGVILDYLKLYSVFNSVLR